MTGRSRTEYSAHNTTVAVAARVLAILAGFFTRVVFTHTLSEEYVGLNGLFTDILNILSLSELGVGTAVTCALYQPIAAQDVERQKSLMRMYRNFYRIVAALVLVLGLSVLPFMDVLIKNQGDIEHITVIYLMYLANSVLSYLLIYKKTLMDAHQLSYIGVLYQTAFLLLQNVLQIGVLLLTGNFILFVAILILCTLSGNLCISRKADRLYPYLKEKHTEELPAEERRGIYQNIRAMLMHKVGNIVVNNTDNLLLSSMVGIVSVSCYSNYYLIIGSVRQVLNQMFQGITASVGNLGVEESRERIKRIFEAAFFAGQWVFGLAAICLYELLDTFVEISFGPQYVFSGNVTLILCINFYLTGMRQASLVFRDSMGLFWYDRFKAPAEAVINLGVSILLGRYLGTAGIFLGTLVSTVATSLWVEPYMLYKYRLKTSVRPYFARYGVYAFVTLALGLGEDMVCRRITGNPWTVCILRLLFCVCVTNLAYLALYFRTAEFQLLIKKAGEMLHGWKKQRDLRKSSGQRSRTVTELSLEEEQLLLILKTALLGGAVSGREAEKTGGGLSGKESTKEKLCWEKVQRMAKYHGVLPLLCQSFLSPPVLPKELYEAAVEAGRRAVMQSYRILFLSKYLTERLGEAGISAAVLKGAATAAFYRVPELRKTGDVDLLLTDPGQLERACRILEKSGFQRKEKQTALHHVVLCTGEGIEIELHTMLAEPFDNRRINRYLEEKLAECREHIVMEEVMGVKLPVLAKGFHAYELLLHMLQHFLRAGFGLKLLCDWVFLWQQETPKKERQLYLRLIRESGLKGFSDMVTRACCGYLGLSEESVVWMELADPEGTEELIAEILEAEEFGRSTGDRMAVPRGSGAAEYIREFHHQMRLNFPKAGRHMLLWPFLWMVTLIRFLRNNRKVRGISGISVLKKAAQRSRLTVKMRLWNFDD